jgi:uncharacterized protein DUF5681
MTAEVPKPGEKADAPAASPLKMQRGRPFARGQSGNPRGKKPGTRNRTSMLVEKLFGDQAEAVVAATLKRALGGSTEAQKLILDRLAPARRDRPATFNLPPIEKIDDLSAVHTSILESVADGSLSPSEGAQIAAIVDARARAVELIEITRRLEAEIKRRLEAVEAEKNR